MKKWCLWNIRISSTITAISAKIKTNFKSVPDPPLLPEVLVKMAEALETPLLRDEDREFSKYLLSRTPLMRKGNDRNLWS